MSENANGLREMNIRLLKNHYFSLSAGFRVVMHVIEWMHECIVGCKKGVEIHNIVCLMYFRNKLFIVCKLHKMQSLLCVI